MKLTNSNSFLSCDWGTSSFRLRLVDTAAGTVFADVKTTRGIQAVYNSWSETGKEQEREAFYYRYLEEQTALLAEKVERDLDGIPVILSGMASSGIGIKELPYAPLPVSLEQPELQLDVRDETTTFPHKVMLISGFCSDHDVMRGEETQLLGLASRYTIENAMCILPGTHSKHVTIQSNKVVDFNTFLTGELFNLLSTKSILRNSLFSDTVFYEESFRRGIEQAQQKNLLTSLFNIRADELLHHTDPAKNYYFLSGLLIGTELAGLRQQPPGRIILAGEDPLQRFYDMALQILGLEYTPVSSAEDLSVEGQRYILNNM